MRKKKLSFLMSVLGACLLFTFATFCSESSLETKIKVESGLNEKEYSAYRKSVEEKIKKDPKITNYSFGKDFFFGAGTSAQQVEGNCTNNTWSQHEKNKDSKGNLWVEQESGLTCDQCTHYKEDVQRIKALGLDVYRFSIEWSKIEPKQGEINKEAMQYYVNLCKELVANGIKPCITLHHYTDPSWFMDLGGFEKKENIKHFVNYAQTVYKELHEDVFLWFTFCVEGYVSKAYLLGTMPPYKQNKQTMCEVTAHILQAHVETYDALKVIDKQPMIGIIKNIYQIDPWSTWNPLDRLASSIAGKLMDDGFYSFFSTGTYAVNIPCMVNVKYTNNHANKTLDFIGLSYYSHAYMKNFKRVLDPNEIKTDNPNYTVYPYGYYRAIKTINEKIAKPLNIPIVLNENGIGTTDDELRAVFTEQYLCSAAQAKQEGCNIIGYIHWSFMDNYEWGTFSKKYGLYSVDFASKDRTRTLKLSGAYFRDLIKRVKKDESYCSKKVYVEENNNSNKKVALTACAAIAAVVVYYWLR